MKSKDDQEEIKAVGRPMKYEGGAKRFLFTLNVQVVEEFDAVLEGDENRSSMVNTLMEKYIKLVRRRNK